MIDPISAGVGAGKALVKAVDSEPELTPEAAKFLDQVSGGARREIGAWIGDHFRYRRMKAQLKLLDKAHEHLRAAGRNPREVKWRVLFPLLEAGSLEEEDGMVARWAALLANAADPGANEVPPSFPEVLKQITPIEARILDLAVTVGDAAGPATGVFTVGHEIRRQVGITEDAYAAAVDNLFRLRLLTPPAIRLEFTNTPDLEYQLAGRDAVQATAFGRAFVAACSPPSGA